MASSSVVVPPPGFLALEEFNYHSTLAAQRGPCLVLFSSAGCGTCRVVAKHLPHSAPEGMPLFYVDAQRSMALVRAMEVFHLPALFLYNHGAFHAAIPGPVTRDALAAALARALAEPAQEEP